MDWKIPLMKVGMADASKLMPALQETLYSGYIAEGEKVREFESRLGSYLANRHVIATNSCTSAITVALAAAEVGPGDVALTSPHTCMATAVPIRTLGATVAWGDLDPETGLLDPNHVEKRLDADSRIKAVICVHWGGDVCDVGRLADICRPRGVTLIEDAAQALGARAPTGVLVGGAGGDYVCFSFQAVKQLTTGDGGALVARTPTLYRKAKPLTWFGINRDTFRREDTGEIDWTIDVTQAGFKAHMNDVTATIGLHQLHRFQHSIGARNFKNGRMLEDLLADVEGIAVPRRGTSRPAYWFFHALVKDPDERTRLIAFLRKRGIQASSAHMRIDGYSCFEDSPKVPLPGADAFSDRQLCLPCGWWMDEFDVRHVADAVRSFYASQH